MNLFEIVILIILSVMITWFSWQISLKDKRYHGIFRFFSFESILLLVMLNYPVWFHDYLSYRQVSSWILLILSLVIALTGFNLLKTRGKAIDNFENTTTLVTSGMYKFIRHPMYLSLLLLGTGVMLKDISTATLSLAAINAIALYLTARIEEKEMISRFGEGYESYRRTSKMFIPFIF
jgi:protein-S-isoprenylcysteine O-methyltransferase Ste14